MIPSLSDVNWRTNHLMQVEPRQVHAPRPTEACYNSVMSSTPAPIPHIEIRPNRGGQPRAYVSGTRVRVQDIVCDSEGLGLTPDEIVANLPHLTLGQVHAALSYYFDHQDEIRAAIRADEEFALSMERQLSGTVRPTTQDGSRASVSSG